MSVYATLGSLSPEIAVSYPKSLVSDTYGRSVAGTLETVIRGLMTDEYQQIHDLDLVSTQELSLMRQWNPTPAPVLATLHGLFEAEAKAHPEAAAIHSRDTTYTYARLDSAANRLAADLASQGVGVESRVILCFAKSAMPIVAMVAVLKAGGVCVSVNHEHPDARILEICNDAEAVAVLCDKQYVGRFTDHMPHAIEVSEATLCKLENEIVDDNWSPPYLEPDHSAFIVYTSGSTGKPKGCLLKHHSVSKSQLVNAKAMKIGPMTRVAQFAAFTFDASICEIFAPLVVGGCVCIISDEARLNNLAKAIDDGWINWIMLIPTVAQLFMP